MSAPNANGALPGSNPGNNIFHLLPFPVPMLPSPIVTAVHMLGILKARVEELEKQLGEEKKKHSQDVKKLERQLQEAKESLKEAHKMVTLETQIASLRERFLKQKFKAIMDRSKLQVVNLSSSIDALQISNESLQKRLEQKSSLVTELQQDNAELTEQNAAIVKRSESDTKDLLDVIDGYTKDINQLEEKNAALTFMKNTEETNKCIQEQQYLRKIEELTTYVEKLEKKLHCIVCYSEEKDVMYLPCLHMAVCKSCADKLSEMSPGKSPICPICSKETRGIAQLYLA